MKVRIYSPYFPYPVTEGAFQVIFDQVLGFAKYHDVELVIWKNSPQEVQKKAPLGLDALFGKKLRLINFNDGSLKGESAWLRAGRVVRSFLAADSSPGIFYYPPELDKREILPPADLAIYHYSFSWSWLQQRKGISEKKQVVYFHNLESDLFQHRMNCEPFLPAKAIHFLNARKLGVHEGELAALTNELWFISPKDREDFVRRYPATPTPLLQKCPSYRESMFAEQSKAFKNQLESDQKVTLGFIGGLDFDANRDSLNWILTEVCPRLQQGGFRGQLLVVGKKAPEWILEKGKQFSFFKYLGFVDDLSDFWKSLSLMLVPHVSGSGVRIKLLDSLASGIPVLANQPAVKRIDSNLLNSPFLKVSDDPQSWAKAILELRGQELRQGLQSRGMDSALQFESIYPEYVS